MNREEKDDTMVHIRSFDTYRPYIYLVRCSGIHPGPNSNPSPGRSAGATTLTRPGSGTRTGSHANPRSVSGSHAGPCPGGYPYGSTT